MDDPFRFLEFAGLACAAKAACVLAGSGLIAFAMKGKAAATRHVVWCLGMAGALAVLPLAIALPRWSVPVLEPSPARTATEPGGGFESLPTPVSNPAELASRPEMTTSSAAASPVAPASIIQARPISPGQWLLAAWCSGSLAVLAWFATGWVRVGRLGREARRITDASWLGEAAEAAARLRISRRVTLLQGGPSAMPITWGVLRPKLLLPAEADAWPLDRRRAVLLHELAHVRRLDGLTQWLSLATCAAYWFNPLAWWSAARVLAEREQACDDLVLEVGERPSDYATQLLVVAKSLRPSPSFAQAAMAMARPSGLELRLVAILDAKRDRRRPARWLMATALVVVLAASATLAVVHAGPREVPRRVVSGRVVGVDDRPIEGASVVVLTSRPVLGPWKSAPYHVLGTAKSDSQGDFRLELADQPAQRSEETILVAIAPGTSYELRTLDDLTSPMKLRLEEPTEVKLVDLQGSPIAGASARLLNVFPHESKGEYLSTGAITSGALPRLLNVVTSDAEGRFSLFGLGADESVTVEVKAEGFGTQRQDLPRKKGVKTTTLAIGRAQVIEGRVTLGKGGPPAIGSTINARSMSNEGGVGQTRGETEVTTDAEGRYRLEAAPGASVRLEVYPPREGADAYLVWGLIVVPTESVSMRQDFVLPKGVLVKGRVTEATTGKPIAGVVVTHQAHQRNNPFYIKGSASFFSGDEQRGITAADGTYQLPVMPGPGYLMANAPESDYLRDVIDNLELHGELIWPNERHYPHAFRKIAPKPDEGTIQVDLNLRAGAKVVGHVVGVDGKPAVGAVMFGRWYLNPWQTTFRTPSVKPIRDGRFELGGCDPRASAPMFFFDAERQQGAVVELNGQQAGQDVEVKLQACGSARIRFVDDQGKPIRKGRLPGEPEVVLTPGVSFAETFFSMKDQKSPLLADCTYITNLDGKRYHDVKVDAEGRATLPSLIPGATYRLGVFNQPVKTEVEFKVQPGEVKDLGDLVIPNIDGMR